MPELPEVEVIARGLAARLEGQRVEAVHLARKDIVRGGSKALFTLPLSATTLDRVRRAGKLVRFDFSDEMIVHIHLGMSGRLLIQAACDPVATHTHLRLGFCNGELELRFCDPRRFGGVWIARQNDAAGWTGRRLPPIASDPLTLKLRDWRRFLSPRRRIKALLMAQDPISGIGNIYCDESLHRAGVHPLTRACDLDARVVARLSQSVRHVLDEAIRAGGSSISDYLNADGEPGTFHQKHRVYGREGKPCRRCRTPIERTVIAGRGTHFCPHCQPLP